MFSTKPLLTINKNKCHANVTFFATKNMTKDLQKPLQIEYLSC